MKKTNILLTLFITFAISFWSCQQSQMPVESDSASSSSVLSKTLDEVNLYLYVNNAGAANYDLIVHKLERDWDEVVVTWSFDWTNPGAEGDYDESTYGSETVVGGPAAAKQWVKIDIKSLWMNGVPPYGLIIKAVNPTDSYRIEFSSIEGANDPYVEVTYTDAPTEMVPVIGDTWIWDAYTSPLGDQHLLYVGKTESREKRTLLKFPVPYGCTLTQGYWKTHYQGRKIDDAWSAVGGPNADFYHSGLTYIQILKLNASKGNAYTILAYQFIAAQLNKANGASIPQAVEEAMTFAEIFFKNDENDGEIGDETDREYLLSQKDILDDYNNGLIGPGHCDD